MSRPHRVLILSQFYFPEVTGSAPVVTNVAEWLVEAGHEVVVVTTRPHYPKMVVTEEYADGSRDREVVNGVTVHRVPPLLGKGRGLVQRAKSEVSYMVAMLRCVRHLPSEAPDVVISLCPSMLTVMGAAAGPARGHRHVVLLHDIQSGLAASLGMGAGRLIWWAMRIVERFALNRAGAVVVLSGAMAGAVRKLGVKKAELTVLPPQIDINLVMPTPERPECAKTVLYSGNLGQKQGMDQIMEMASVLLAERSDIQIVIRGEGNQRSKLEQQATERHLSNVRFQHLCPSGELAEAFGACAVHLVPQRSQTGDYSVPSKLYTIMAAGRPAICTAAAGSALYGLMGDSEAIVCVPPDNPQALAAAVTELMADQGKRQRLGRAGRAYVEKHLSRDTVIDDIERLFQPPPVGGARLPQTLIAACTTGSDRRGATPAPRGRTRIHLLRQIKKFARRMADASGPRAMPEKEQ